jgi:RNA polymerase sigma-70 factor (ECF subfamily)
LELEEVYGAYFKDVYLYLLGLTKNEHLADELTSDVFFQAMQGLRGFRGQCDVRVWLCQIAKNAYFSYLRKAGRTVPLEMEPPQAKPAMEEVLLDKDAALRLHAILHNLPEPYKEVFTLRIFGELSFQQIGGLFGRTANWACVTYHRARQKMQDRLEEEI